MQNYEQHLIDTYGLTIPKDEVAKLLNIHPLTLYRLAKDGKIKPKKIGGRVLYTPKEIVRFLELT